MARGTRGPHRLPLVPRSPALSGYSSAGTGAAEARQGLLGPGGREPLARRVLEVELCRAVV